MQNSFNFVFAQFDPRNISAAAQVNEGIFASGPVLGIEVTISALAQKCTLGNIDPQHTGGDASHAAIEAALTHSLPPAGSVLATVRVDLDAAGAMAILELRARGSKLTQAVLDRVGLIAASDKFEKGEWARKELPSSANLWPQGESLLAALGAAVCDFKVSLADRVAIVATWLVEGIEPESYGNRVEKERQDLVSALERGDIRVEEYDGICAVTSSHRAAMLVGYSHAPVVVAMNSEFKGNDGKLAPHRKFTVAQFKAGYVDMMAVKVDLLAREEGWGGTVTILGSRQDGISSVLSIEEIVEVVRKHRIH